MRTEPEVREDRIERSCGPRRATEPVGKWVPAQALLEVRQRFCDAFLDELVVSAEQHLGGDAKMYGTPRLAAQAVPGAGVGTLDKRSQSRSGSQVFARNSNCSAWSRRKGTSKVAAATASLAGPVSRIDAGVDQSLSEGALLWPTIAGRCRGVSAHSATVTTRRWIAAPGALAPHDSSGHSCGRSSNCHGDHNNPPHQSVSGAATLSAAGCSQGSISRPSVAAAATSRRIVPEAGEIRLASGVAGAVGWPHTRKRATSRPL